MVDGHFPPIPPSIRRVDPDVKTLCARADFVPIAAALAEEMATWVQEAALLLPTPPGGWSDERDSILCALMVRLSKLLRRISSTCKEGDVEATEIFARGSIETIVNFHFLYPDETGSDRLQKFKASGYATERMILHHLDGKEQAKGLDDKEQQAKDGLLGFMTENGLLDTQGVGKFWKRLEAAGLDRQMETYLWSMPSKAVHGTYPNLVGLHLQQQGEDVFTPNFGLGEVNPVIPMSCIHLTLEMLDRYILRMGEEVYAAWRPVLEELESRLQRIRLRQISINEQG